MLCHKIFLEKKFPNNHRIFFLLVLIVIELLLKQKNNLFQFTTLFNISATGTAFPSRFFRILSFFA